MCLKLQEHLLAKKEKKEGLSHKIYFYCSLTKIFLYMAEKELMVEQTVFLLLPDQDLLVYLLYFDLFLNMLSIYSIP
jgi:hypothetical protein